MQDDVAMSENAVAVPLLNDVMPNMVAHKGLWRGVYTHIDETGALIERHNSEVECIFPSSGNIVYLQKNYFTWDDGRERRVELPGVLKNGKIWWDTETFSGYGWETDDGMTLLNLQRKDIPGANFFELIAMGDTGEYRSRTWHWFKDGKLFKRTLCEERRVA